MTAITVNEPQYVVRRCSACQKMNRVVLEMALCARCGQCGQELLISYYDILGLTLTAGSEQLKSAYRRRVLEWHPDRQAKQDSSSNHRLQQIVAAYRTLANPETRTQYNHTQVPRIHIEPASAADQRRPQKQAPSAASAAPRHATAVSKTQPASWLIRVTVPFLVLSAVFIFGLLFWLRSDSPGPGLTAIFIFVTLFLALSGVSLLVFSLTFLSTTTQKKAP